MEFTSHLLLCSSLLSLIMIWIIYTPTAIKIKSMNSPEQFIQIGNDVYINPYWLRYKRRERDLSLRDLSKYACCSPSYLCTLEKGKKHLKVDSKLGKCLIDYL